MTLSMACSSCSSFSLLLSDLDFSFPLLPERLLFSELLCVELCNRNVRIQKTSAVVVVTYFYYKLVKLEVHVLSLVPKPHPAFSRFQSLGTRLRSAMAINIYPVRTCAPISKSHMESS